MHDLRPYFIGNACINNNITVINTSTNQIANFNHDGVGVGTNQNTTIANNMNHRTSVVVITMKVTLTVLMKRYAYAYENSVGLRIIYEWRRLCISLQIMNSFANAEPTFSTLLLSRDY